MYWNRSKHWRRLETSLEFDVEVVERRVLLAGDVMADLTAGGDLTLRGDGEANQNPHRSRGRGGCRWKFGWDHD